MSEKVSKFQQKHLPDTLTLRMIPNLLPTTMLDYKPVRLVKQQTLELHLFYFHHQLAVIPLQQSLRWLAIVWPLIAELTVSILIQFA